MPTKNDPWQTFYLVFKTWEKIKEAKEKKGKKKPKKEGNEGNENAALGPQEGTVDQPLNPVPDAPAGDNGAGLQHDQDVLTDFLNEHPEAAPTDGTIVNGGETVAENIVQDGTQSIVDNTGPVIEETVTETVGGAVGDTVGETVIEDTVTETVGGTVTETVGGTVGDTVGETVIEDTVTETVGETVIEDTVVETVGGTTGGTIGAPTTGELGGGFANEGFGGFRSAAKQLKNFGTKFKNFFK